MYGKPTDTEVVLYGKTVKTLLDTGSTVSTISHTYYHSNLTDIPLLHMNELLDIECADGKQLPYEGYIETAITLPHQSNTDPCLLLLILDSNYHTHIPLLLGTNTL